MRSTRFILFIVAMAGVTHSAIADVWTASPVHLEGISEAPAALPAKAADGQNRVSWLDSCLGRSEECDSSVAVTTEGDPTARVPGNVWQMPSVPGSSSLFLSALLSAGAFHLARKARNAHLGHLPAWYHEAGPERIGHTVVFDLNTADMPVCFVAQTTAASSCPAIRGHLREPRSRFKCQFFLPVTAPRGPPGLS